jgi:exopolysaccharide production protein ExoZ
VYPERNTEDPRKSRLHSIQVLRAIAAGCVVLHHITYELRNFTPHIPLWLESLHLEFGVDIFFIISGFVMMWSFGENFGKQGATAEFFRRRIIRIVPPYWFFTAIVTSLVITRPDLFDKTAFSLDHFVMSLLFIPHYAPDGSLRPIHMLGWTLDYEMFFYLIFGISLFLTKGRAIIFIIFALGVAVLLGNICIGTGVAVAYFLSNSIIFEFVIGILLCLWLYPAGTLVKYRAVTVLCFALLGWALTVNGLFGEIRFISLGLPALAVAITIILALDGVEQGWVRWAALVGEASYAIYLSHPLIVEGLSRLFRDLDLAPGQPALYAGSYVIVTVFAIIGFGILYYIFIERPVYRTLLTHLPSKERKGQLV